jgi:hypothetical protein
MPAPLRRQTLVGRASRPTRRRGKGKSPLVEWALLRPGSGLFSLESCPSSIVSAEAFHFRVRDGNGWSHLALTTKTPNNVSRERISDMSPAEAQGDGRGRLVFW